MLLTLWVLAPNAARQPIRERALDLLVPLVARATSGGADIVIVDIDRDAIARFGPWPWPRERMAALVSAAAAGQPAVLAIDILFAGTDRLSEDGDAALTRALSAVPSVLGFALEPGNAGDRLRATPILSRSPVSLPDVWQAKGAIGPAPALADAAQGTGALAEVADPDGPIRRLPLLVMTGTTARPGLAVEAVRLAQGASALLIDPRGRLMIGDVAVPLGRDAMLRLWGAPSRTTIPATKLMDDPNARNALSGRIVLIGSSAPEAGGLRVTPVSPATPSVQLQAEAIEQILRGEVFTRPYWAEFAEPIGAALLGLFCLAAATRLRPAAAALVAGALCLMWIGAAAAAVPSLGLLIDPAGPPVIALLAFALTTLARFARDEWRARMLQVRFEQHLSPEVVRRIAANPGALRLRGEMREITSLFTDIEGFTAMTERAKPEDLIALLDAYFDVTTRVITEHGGMVDKIIGDAIHALFNAPFALENHPQRAVASAIALLDATEKVRRSPLGQALKLGRTRVGIETGRAIVGDVGGSRKLDYTAHGNAINAAARLEQANKELGSAICIGPGTAARLDPATLRHIGTLTLRGQTGEISVYTPVSLTE